MKENDAFVVNEDGTITIKVPGIYEVKSDGPNAIVLTLIRETTQHVTEGCSEHTTSKDYCPYCPPKKATHATQEKCPGFKRHCTELTLGGGLCSVCAYEKARAAGAWTSETARNVTYSEAPNGTIAGPTSWTQDVTEGDKDGR